MELRNSRSGIGWSKEQTSLFISIFEQYPCLYDPKDSHYLDKFEKNKKRLYIVQVMKKIRPNVTVKDIKAKIKTLTNQLSREQQKIIASRKSGCSLEDIYIPKLWCYDQLKFLLNCVESKTREAEDIRQTEFKKVSKAVKEIEALRKAGAAKTALEIREVENICETETMGKTDNVNSFRRQKTKKKRRRSSTGVRKATLRLMNILTSSPAKEEENKSTNREVVKFCQYLETDLEQIKISENFNALKVEIVNLVHSYIKKDKADRAAISLVQNIEQDKKRKRMSNQPYNIYNEASCTFFEQDFNRKQTISSSSSADSPPRAQARNQH